MSTPNEPSPLLRLFLRQPVSEVKTVFVPSGLMHGMTQISRPSTHAFTWGSSVYRFRR